MVVPSSKGLNESFISICKKVVVQVHFKESNIIKDPLVAPKDNENITSKGSVIYRYKCHHTGCTVEYIGETGRTFGEKYKKHLRAPFSIYDHANTTGHSIQLDNFSIVDRESLGFLRTIKAMFIRVNDPPLNRNLGKYQLTHSWDEVLQDTLALHLQ